MEFCFGVHVGTLVIKLWLLCCHLFIHFKANNIFFGEKTDWARYCPLLCGCQNMMQHLYAWISTWGTYLCVCVCVCVCLCVLRGHNSKGGAYLKGWGVILTSNFPVNANCNSKLECIWDKEHKSLCVCFQHRISLKSSHIGIPLFQFIQWHFSFLEDRGLEAGRSAYLIVSFKGATMQKGGTYVKEYINFSI